MDDEDKSIEELLDNVFAKNETYFLEWFQNVKGINSSNQQVRVMAAEELKKALRDPQTNFIKELLSDKPELYSAKQVAQSFVNGMKQLPYWQEMIASYEDEFTDELLDTVADINRDLLSDWYKCFNGRDNEQRLKVKREIQNTLRDTRSLKDPNINFIMRLMSEGANGYKDVRGECKKRVRLAEILLHAMRQRQYWVDFIENTDRYSVRQNISDSHVISRAKTSCMSLEQIKQKYRQQDTSIYPLHEAARLEDVETVRRLIDEGEQIESDEHNGCTPLHAAAMAINPNAEIARRIVDAMGQAGIRSMINKRSDRSSGRNTALHIAAGNVNVTHAFIEQLKDADPVVFNSAGFSPFHLAAKSRNQKVIIYMLNIFAPTNKGWDVDYLDDHEGLKPADRLINICAINGNAEAVALLIKHGADISRGILHEIVRESVIVPQKIDQLVDVYHRIVDNAVTWRCLEEKWEDHPLKGSDSYKTMKGQTMMYLLTNPLEEDNPEDVLEYAISRGASTMFQQILNTMGVFRYINVFIVRFDVTNFTKETTICEDVNIVPDEIQPDRNGQHERVPLVSTGLDPVDSAGRPRRDFNKRRTPKTPYLTYLLRCFGPRWKSSNVLSMQPLNQLTKPYFALIQRFYLLIGLLQLVFMVLFSAHYMPDTCSLSLMFDRNVTHCTSSSNMNNSKLLLDADSNTTGAPNSMAQRRSSTAWVWLIWPTILIIGSVVGSYYSAKSAALKPGDIRHYDKIVRFALRCTCLTRRLVSGLLHSVVMRLFCCSVFLWFYKYRKSVTHDSYAEVTAAVLLFGWITSLGYLGAVSKSFSISALVVKEIIAKDIPSFVLFFAFTVVGFSFAMHAIRVSACELSIIDFQDTFYGLLSSAFGIGDFFETAITDRSCVGIDRKHLFEAMYFTYIGVTLIVLMNVLIAMMNDRYTLAKDRAETIWKFRILSMMTTLESQIGFTNIMKKCRILDLWRPHKHDKTGSYESRHSQLCYFGCCFNDKYKGYVKFRKKEKTFSLCFDQV